MDPTIIASCICRLLENPQFAKQMGQAGAARIDAHAQKILNADVATHLNVRFE